MHTDNSFFLASFPGQPTQPVIELIEKLGGRIFTHSLDQQLNSTPRRHRILTDQPLSAKIGGIKRQLIPFCEFIQRDPRTPWRALIFVTQDLDTVTVAQETRDHQFRLMIFSVHEFKQLIDRMGPGTFVTTAVTKLLQANGVEPEYIPSLKDVCSRLWIDPGTLP
jgi:hypothetical protein